MGNRKNAGLDPTHGLPVCWEASVLDRDASMIYEDQLMAIAMSRFEWRGLPDTCDARYLEWCLLAEGCATLAVSNGSLYSLMAVQQGAPNMYDNPRAWIARGQTGEYQFPCDWRNGVFVWDNDLRVSTLYKLRYFAAAPSPDPHRAPGTAIGRREHLSAIRQRRAGHPGY